MRVIGRILRNVPDFSHIASATSPLVKLSVDAMITGCRSWTQATEFKNSDKYVAVDLEVERGWTRPGVSGTVPDFLINRVFCAGINSDVVV
jgi:hypothetical protein